MRTRRISLVVGAIVVALVAAACSPPNALDAGTNSAGFGNSGNGSGTAKSGKIKIGVVGNFSGPLSYIGLAVEAGAQHATDVLNEESGIDGREIELVKCDAQFSPSTELNCLTKMTSVDKVEMIIVDTPNGIDALGPEKTQELGVPVMLPLICGPGITPEDFPNVFCMGRPITESTDLEVIAEFLVAQQGRRDIAIVASDDPFFTEAATSFSQELGKHGVAPTTTEKFTFGDIDMSAQVRAAQGSGADTVMCLGLGADCARVVQAMRNAGYEAQFAGTSTLYMRAFRELAKEDSNEAVFTLPHSKTNDVDPAFVQWLFDFLRRYGFRTFVIGGSTSPDYPGVEFPTYRTLDVYSKAVKVAGSTDAEAVVKALERDKGYESVNITQTWGPDTRYATLDPESEPWVARFTNGHFSWDVDPRSVPALEEVRIAWEEQMFGGDETYASDVEFIIASVEIIRTELEAREDAVVAAEGQARYDERIAQLDQALAVAKEIEESGDTQELPDLG